MKDYDRALADFSNVIKFEPHSAQAYYTRGRVYGDLNDVDHALADFARAQKLDPLYSPAITEKVLGLTPNTAEGWFRLDLALIHQTSRSGDNQLSRTHLD